MPPHEDGLHSPTEDDERCDTGRSGARICPDIRPSNEEGFGWGRNKIRLHSNVYPSDDETVTWQVEHGEKEDRPPSLLPVPHQGP